MKKHPHVRGEDELHSMTAGETMETPPRAWGRHIMGAHDFVHNRNTPTCVGKTQVQADRFDKVWKHPHVRGEDTVCRAQENP